MYENITPELRSLLEPRLDLIYFAKKNFCFKSLTFKEIDNLNFENIYKQITIFFLLDENFEDLKNSDNLRKLLTCSLVFTNLNLFKIYGVPERFFTFNAIIDERDFFISNNSERNIANHNYNIENIYSGLELNNIQKVNLPYIEITKQNKQKIFLDVLKFLCCGCSVFVSSSNILDLFCENTKAFLNCDLSESLKLDVQFDIHKNYSYIGQINNIEVQLYGIYGNRHDLLSEQ